MTLVHHHAGWVIWTSFLVALILTILPLPAWAGPYRPEWTLLVLIYWCMAIPQRVGIGVGWVVGILLDALRESLLGQNALGFALAAFVTIKLHQRLRVFPRWQQALTVMFLVAIHQMLNLWVKGISGQAPASLQYWLPTFTSTLLWPWVFVTLRDARRRFRVS